jgi:hypothetical protein
MDNSSSKPTNPKLPISLVPIFRGVVGGLAGARPAGVSACTPEASAFLSIRVDSWSLVVQFLSRPVPGSLVLTNNSISVKPLAER